MRSEQQTITDDPAPRSHCQKWWTTAQRQLLQQLRADNVPWDEVARACGHTVGSCRTTLANLRDRTLMRAAGDPKPKIMRRPWSEAEVARLIQLYEVDGLLFGEIDRELKRARGCSSAKYESLRRPAARSFISREARVAIDQAAFESAAARKLAEQRKNITQNFFGDPAPGYSALDRRNSGARR